MLATDYQMFDDRVDSKARNLAKASFRNCRRSLVHLAVSVWRNSASDIRLQNRHGSLRASDCRYMRVTMECYQIPYSADLGIRAEIKKAEHRVRGGIHTTTRGLSTFHVKPEWHSEKRIPSPMQNNVTVKHSRCHADSVRRIQTYCRRVSPGRHLTVTVHNPTYFIYLLRTRSTNNPRTLM